MGAGNANIRSEFVDGDLVFKAVDGTTLLTLTAAGAVMVGTLDLLSIPTADQEDSSSIWLDSGVLKVSTAG